MLTPRIEHNIDCHMCEPRCGRPAYYDTFALRDRGDRRGVGFSCNPFWVPEDRNTWAAGQPVAVHSAFGGAALVRSSPLRQCAWDADGDCEHVGFARQLRAYGRVLAVPTIRTWTTSDEMQPTPAFLQMQRGLLANPLLLRFWTSRNWGDPSAARP